VGGEVFPTPLKSLISTSNVTTVVEQSIAPNKHNLLKECGVPSLVEEEIT